MDAAALMHWIRPILTHTAFISPDEVRKRHNSREESFLPDFLLYAPNDTDAQTEDVDPWADPTYALPFFLDLITYPGDEGSAEMAISGFFLPTPGCTLYG